MPTYKNPELLAIKEGRFEPIRWDEFRYFYKKAWDEEHANLLVFAYLTGIRPIEINFLKREDFDKRGSYLQVRIATAKRGMARTLFLPICNEETEKLKEWVFSKVFPKEYIFPSFVKVKARDRFLHLNRKCEIGRWVEGKFYPFSFYVFRHNILTLLAENGADFLELQMFKGARVDRRLFGSVAYYIHFSEKMALKIGKILRKIMKE